MDSSASSFPGSMAATPTNTWDYGVYLSYRSGHIRNTLLDHIQHRLEVAKIPSLIYDLPERESSVRYELIKAIPRSRLCLVVLSPDYASSEFCLDELDRIMKCRRAVGNMVVPVFDGVDFSEVRGLSGHFGEAFARIGEDIPTERVMRWQKTLMEAADLPGWDIRGWDDATAAQIILRDILDKLVTAESKTYAGTLFGIAPKINEVKQLLDLRSDDIRKIGIWGMGGIGKTSIAKVIFESICQEFEACCFVKNVRETVRKYGLASLERTLLAELVLWDGKRNVEAKQQGSYLTKDMLNQKRILVVLDGVNSKEHLELFSGGPDWFGRGSRIIVTTRNKRLLDGADAVYNVTSLEDDAALQLFSWHAFRRNQPASEYLQKSENFVSYAKGHPLALTVLGSYVCNGTLIEWQSALENLQKFPNKQIVEVLGASLDGLSTDEKEAFLDIACFLDEEDLDITRNILDVRGLNADQTIRSLMDKTLLTVTDNKLSMHDLVVEMGKAMVRKESKDPDRRSRLWLAKDIGHVIMKQKVSLQVEAISMDLSKTRKMVLPSDAFQRMPKLKLLRFFNCQPIGHSYDFHFPKGLHYLPEELRFLQWDAFPLEALPMAFTPTNLVELRMPFSRVKELWTTRQCASNLKLIDLSHSDVTRIHELLQADALETICLKECKNLVDVSSVQYFTNLEHLNLRGCTNLRKLPSMEHCKKLTTLDLSNCSSLGRLPELPRNIKYIYLSRLLIKELHPSVEHLCELVELDVGYCKKLRHFPTSICKLASLRKLVVSGCPNINRDNLLKQMRDASILHESDHELNSYGLLQELKYILQEFLEMEKMEWLLLYASIVLEGTSAVFEQLQYSLLSMVMAVLGLLLCHVELTCKVQKERATFEYRGFLPWFYSTYPEYKLFGSTTEYFGLAAAIWQLFHSTIGYIYARKSTHNPIQMTIIMFLFFLCQLTAKLIKKYSKPDPELEVIVVQI